MLLWSQPIIITKMLLILVAVLVLAIDGRYFETMFKFSMLGKNRGWVYLDKMTFAPGGGFVEFETHTTGLPFGGHSELFMVAVSQKQWQEQSLMRCQRPPRMPLAVHRLNLDGQITSSSVALQLQEYTTYYFVLKDCQQRFINDWNNSNLSLNVRLHLMNNGREIGQEEDHWYVVAFIVVAGLALIHYYLKQYGKSLAQTDSEWARMMLFMGTATQISSLFWKSIGFVIYRFTGNDYFFFHLIYLLLHSTSESAILALVTLMAFGWTLTFQRGNSFDLFLPLVGCLAAINVILTMIIKIGHEHDRHHLFDSPAGGIMVWFRIFVLALFVVGCVRTYKQVRVALKKFMSKLGLLGFLYVAAVPVIVVAANVWVQAKDRNEFVFVCVQVVKFVTNFVLGYEMNEQASEYNRVNYKNASFIPDEQQGFK